MGRGTWATRTVVFSQWLPSLCLPEVRCRGVTEIPSLLRLLCSHWWPDCWLLAKYSTVNNAYNHPLMTLWCALFTATLAVLMSWKLTNLSTVYYGNLLGQSDATCNQFCHELHSSGYLGSCIPGSEPRTSPLKGLFIDWNVMCLYGWCRNWNPFWDCLLPMQQYLPRLESGQQSTQACCSSSDFTPLINYVPRGPWLGCRMCPGQKTVHQSCNRVACNEHWQYYVIIIGWDFPIHTVTHW